MEKENAIQWEEQLGVAITVCDTDGSILYMNHKSADTFSNHGGKALIGKSLFDCHPPEARKKIQELLQDQKTNAYTIEKNGIKKLIYQTPWFENGTFAGLVEFSIPLPEELPHYIRK